MSGKTLTDELRSVLLFHALEAPQPNATVDRILNDTVGAVTSLSTDTPAGPERRPRRVSALQLAAAAVVAVLLLSVAAINSARNHNASRTASSAGQAQASQAQASQAQASQPQVGQDQAGRAPQVSQPPRSSQTLTTTSRGFALPSTGAARPGPATPPVYSGGGLDCAKLPGGGRLASGQWDDYVLGTGETGYLYEFVCVGQNGQRSASEVQMFKQVGGTLRYKETLLRAALDQHLDFLTAGGDTVRIQALVHSAAAGRQPGEVVSTVWDLTDAHPGDGHTFTVAEPCRREDLTATVTEAPDAAAPAWRLILRNHAATACALEGYPQVRAQRADVTLTSALQTLNGAAGGITKTLVPPIIVLSPDASASALIEQSAASAAGSCPRSDRLAVTLPDGVALGLLPAELSACGLAVHPLVGNVRGSD